MLSHIEFGYPSMMTGVNPRTPIISRVDVLVPACILSSPRHWCGGVLFPDVDRAHDHKKDFGAKGRNDSLRDSLRRLRRSGDTLSIVVERPRVDRHWLLVRVSSTSCGERVLHATHTHSTKKDELVHDSRRRVFCLRRSLCYQQHVHNSCDG